MAWLVQEVDELIDSFIFDIDLILIWLQWKDCDDYESEMVTPPTTIGTQQQHLSMPAATFQDDIGEINKFKQKARSKKNSNTKSMNGIHFILRSTGTKVHLTSFSLHLFGEKTSTFRFTSFKKFIPLWFLWKVKTRGKCKISDINFHFAPFHYVEALTGKCTSETPSEELEGSCRLLPGPAFCQ